MKTRSLSLALGMTLTIACAHARADVQLTALQRENLGIKTVTLTKSETAKTYTATALVLDATSLVTLLSDLRAAQSAATASRNELERVQQLHADENNVSLKVVEAARTQSVADAGHVNTLRAQLATWGPSIAAMPDAERDRLSADLAANRSALLRAELRQSGSAPFRQARVRILNREESWPALVIGLASQTASQGIGHAYLLRVDAASLQAGQVATAELIDTHKSVAGVKIPRSAIVRWQGSAWVFIETDGKFVRRLIRPVEWLDDGCLVQEDLQGQQLVVVGASMLLAAESTGAQE
jgi:hypothetical protein